MYFVDIVLYFIYIFFDVQVCDLFYNFYNYDFFSVDYKFEKKFNIIYY